MAEISSSVAAIESTFKEMLRDAGFRKRARTWRKLADDVIMVVNLQRSQWSKRYYVNLGVYVVALDENGKHEPLEVDCHFRTRLCGLVANRRQFEEALDAENELDRLVREDIIGTALRETGLPFLKSLTQAIKEALGPQNGESISSIKSLREVLNNTDGGIFH